MDIEQFAQCLSYIKSSATTSTVDKLIPLVGTFLGAILGFGLNFFSTSRKEAKTNKAKKACCEEDIDELMHVSKHGLLSLLEISQTIFEKERPTGHNLPSSINTPLLDKYYPDIAHSFSVDQRYWIKLVSRSLNHINSDLELLMAHDEETSLFRISLFVINLEVWLFEIYKLCCCIMADKKFEFSGHDEALLELDIPRKHIISLSQLKANAEKSNMLLHLPK